MSRKKLSRQSLLSILMTSVVLIVWGQACSSNVGFIGLSSASTSSSSDSSSSSQPSLGSPTTDGNGNTYDGKIRVVHRYDDTQRYWCNDHVLPESILYRLDDSSNEWFYIQNYPGTCQSAAAVKVSGVVYDDVLVEAKYNNKDYQKPRQIVSNPLEDANLADVNLYDGVCANVNGKCSLRAAVEQASFISFTSDSTIQVLAGVYKLTQALVAQTGNDHKINIVGEEVTKVIIDGQNMTNHFNLLGNAGAVDFNSLTFTRGKTNSTATSPFNSGSSIIAVNFSGIVNINNCIFDGNENKYVVKTESSLAMNIRKSQFINNNSIGALSTIYTFGTPLLVEDTIVANNNGIGIGVENRTYNVTIRNSAIYNNERMGIFFMMCMNCVVENSTIHRNGIGMSINSMNMGGAGPDYDVIVKNSTIVGNKSSDPGGANLNLGFYSTTTRLHLQNSVLANEPGTPNCTWGGWSPYSQHEILATNSLFDDSSCSLSGAGNIVGVEPQLELLGNNGGLTPTLKPLTGSPLIDAGDNASCMMTDQRGQSRPVNKLGLPIPTCDIGAVELQ